jgi:hypothetical protein
VVVPCCEDDAVSAQILTIKSVGVEDVKVIKYTNNSIKIIFHPTLFHPTRFEIYVLSLSKITFYHHINFFLVDIN